MSSCLDQVTGSRAMASPFNRLVAFTVYDGPLSGIVICERSDEAFLFSLLAWDDQQVTRVFSLAPLDGHVLSDVLSLLTNEEQAHWPEWWLSAPSNDDSRAKQELATSRAIAEAKPVVSILVTRDMLLEIQKAVSLTDSMREEFEHLSRRVTPDAEVSDGSFAQWLSFVEGNVTA